VERVTTLLTRTGWDETIEDTLEDTQDITIIITIIIIADKTTVTKTLTVPLLFHLPTSLPLLPLLLGLQQQDFPELGLDALSFIRVKFIPKKWFIIDKMNAKKKVFLYFSVMYFLLHIDLMGYTKTDTASNKERKIIF